MPRLVPVCATAKSSGASTLSSRKITDAGKTTSSLQAARDDNEIVAVGCLSKLMVARIHAGNTCPKKPRQHPRQWSQVDVSEIPQEFLESARKAVSLAT